MNRPRHRQTEHSCKFLAPQAVDTSVSTVQFIPQTNESARKFWVVLPRPQPAIMARSSAESRCVWQPIMRRFIISWIFWTRLAKIVGIAIFRDLDIICFIVRFVEWVEESSDSYLSEVGFSEFCLAYSYIKRRSYIYLSILI